MDGWEDAKAWCGKFDSVFTYHLVELSLAAETERNVNDLLTIFISTIVI